MLSSGEGEAAALNFDKVVQAVRHQGIVGVWNRLPELQEPPPNVGVESPRLALRLALDTQSVLSGGSLAACKGDLIEVRHS